MPSDNTEMLKKWMKRRFEGQEQQLDNFFIEVEDTFILTLVEGCLT